ncbi:MAG TPA: FMN-binding negative transcriptional regulator [Bacillales bacterium]|nr:FMN-binding negative transcriptional regulator [Bacillales bacterium]
MYLPRHFKVADEDVLLSFIEEHSFGVLFSNHDGRPEATHLPFLVDRESGCLLAHFAKANPQWRDIWDQEVLAVFQGPHHYVSSSWYETNRSVPTWDYVTVHVRGRLERVSDTEEMMEIMNRMVSFYESPESAYHIDETNERYIERMLGGVVGFRLRIDELEGKWKLNQNHPKERRERVAHELEKIGSEDALALARMMREQM